MLDTEKQLPPFTDEMQEWFRNALCYFFRHIAVKFFMEIFPQFNNTDYGTQDEIEYELRKRVKEIMFTLSFSNKERKQAEQTIQKNLTLYFPLAHPIRRIAKYTEMYYREDANVSSQLKILSEIRKEMKELEAFGRFPQDTITENNFS